MQKNFPWAYLCWLFWLRLYWRMATRFNEYHRCKKPYLRDLLGSVCIQSDCLVQTVCKVQCQLLMFIISNPMRTFAIEALIVETTFLNKKGGFIETILTQRVYYHHRPPPLCVSVMCQRNKTRMTPEWFLDKTFYRRICSGWAAESGFILLPCSCHSSCSIISGPLCAAIV